MKKLLIASVALFGFAGGALGADLPARQAPPVFTPVPVFTWTGFYVGVNAGFAWQDRRRDRVDVPADSIVGFGGNPAVTVVFTDDRDDEGGFTGGGQVGFNWQTGMFVWGIEADLQYADLSRGSRATQSYTIDGVSATAGDPFIVRRGVGVDWFGTVRGRLGIALDRTLIYGTGGFAYGGSDNDCRGFGSFTCDDDVRGGYAVGGGLEYAFTNNITAKIEGLYVNLERDRRTTGSVLDPATNTLFLDERRRDDDFAVVRAGLNFKFGSW